MLLKLKVICLLKLKGTTKAILVYRKIIFLAACLNFGQDFLL